MKKWIWAMTAAAACLLGTPTAHAEYVIIRVILNKSALTTPTTGGGFLGGPGTPGMPGPGMPGPGTPGMPGPGRPGGNLGMGGFAPGGMGGFPPGPGIPGGPGGGRPPGVGALGMMGGGPGPGPGGIGGRGIGGGFPGPGGGAVGNGGGNRGGMPGPGMPGPGGGGATGFVGGSGPGFLGGSGGNTAQPSSAYKLGPDDYVTVVVPIHRFDAIKGVATYGKGEDGRPEKIAKLGHFHFDTKYGTTFIDINQSDIILDYKGVNGKQIDEFPDTKKQLAQHKRDPHYGPPEGQLQLAEWCLEVGLPDDAIAIMDKLAANPAKDTFKQNTAMAVNTYLKVKDALSANIEKSDRANQWKDRLGYQALSISKHYAIVHQENTQASANRRLDALEMNFKTIYLWFAMRGRALPAPSEKLVAVIVGDSTDFRRYRDTFEATNLVADGFYARRENLAIFSGRRLDKASVNFEQIVRDIYRSMKPEDLFKSKLPVLKEQPNAPETFSKYARASTLALVDSLLQEEAEIASATHEGTKQIFADTGMLPRNVLAPEWFRFGIAALFEMPKGPFPGGDGQLKVAMHPGGGGPNWAYMRYFEEMHDKKQITVSNAPDKFIETVTDEHFRKARKAEALARAQGNKNEEGDSKATPAEVLYAQARTYAWSVVYFLAKEKFPAFEQFMVELTKLPRDAELDADAVVLAFCKAYGISTAGLTGANVDAGRFAGVGLEWMKFMSTQQSPSRALKIDGLVTTPGGGAGSGVPGFPGGPGGPSGPGGGRPSGPGGRPGGGGGRPGGGGRGGS